MRRQTQSRTRRIIPAVLFSVAAMVLAACSSPDPCAGITCSGRGACVAVSGLANCSCDPGYEADGLSCEKPDPCAGRECGVVNGQFCGTCASSKTCNAMGRCEVALNPCAGRECGFINGQSCGTCTGSKTCNAMGRCEAAPNPCAGRQCGFSGGVNCGSCSGSQVCTSAGQCVATTASLKVVNNTSFSLWYLYVSPTWASDWGPEQLGGKIIPSGTSFTLSGIPCIDTYDLKVTDSTKTREAIRYDVTFTCGSTYTWTIIN